MAVKSGKIRKQQRGKREALAPLPESGDKFWDNAEVEKTKMRSAPKCNHVFIRRTGREVECLNCHAGFVLGNNWHLKEGHIYYKNKRAL